ncbi:MAG: diaminopimelate epimerase [Candidatus Omnitrophota bacterium]
MKKIEFVKLVAAGNDFVLIDNFRASLKINYKNFARKICHRKFGAGADGLLVVEPAEKFRFKMRIFNPDGSEPEMCGNGARGFALYLGLKYKIKNFQIETRAGEIAAKVSKNIVRIKMTDPQKQRFNLKISLAGRDIQAHFINTGVPHVVYFVDNLDKIDLGTYGRMIRFHNLFKPQGTNANFVRMVDRNTIRLRTYERGVEGETLACGTGSVASAIIAVLINRIKTKGSCKVQVLTQSGEKLRVYFNRNDQKISNVWLEGKASLVYQGVYLLR